MRVAAAVYLLVLLAGCGSAPSDDAPHVVEQPRLACDPCLADIEQPQLACNPCRAAIDASPARSWEPTVAADPQDPAHLVASSTVLESDAAGRFTFWLIVHVSNDRGLTWTSARLPGGLEAGHDHPLAGATSLGDPSVVILDDGGVLVSGGAITTAESATEGLRRGYDLFVARSDDGGLTFPQITIVAHGAGVAAGSSTLGETVGLGGVPLLWRANDKETLAVGRDGTILLAWTDLSQFSDKDPVGGSCDIMAASSHDGVSWSPPQVVEAGCFNGASPAVLDSGTWAIAYFSVLDGSLRVARSTDQGTKWKATEIGASLWMPALDARMTGRGELLALASAESDPSDGHEVATLRTSDDDGITWSAPLPLHMPQGRARVLATVQVASDGTVFSAFFEPNGTGTGDQARRDYRAVAVRDGQVVSMMLLDTVDGVSGALGDYMGMASAGDGVFAVWVTRHGDAFDVVGAQLVLR